MDDFKKLTEQLLKIYINAESVNGLDIEKYFEYLFQVSPRGSSLDIYDQCN